MRRSSIPQHLLPGPPRIQAPTPTLASSSPGSSDGFPNHRVTFGPGALEDFDVRRRGSSASSSVAFLEGHGRVHRGSAVGSFGADSGPILGLGTNAAARGSLTSNLGLATSPAGEPTSWLGGHSSSIDTAASGSESEELISAGVGAGFGAGIGANSGDGDGDGAGTSRALSPEERLREGEWELKQKRLVAKVERKREEGLQRSKEGAFPPPEEGYQFPSPVLGSPRMSAEAKRSPAASPTPGGEGLPVKGLFGDKRILPPASPSTRDRHRSPFAPSYLPLSLPGGIPPSLVPPPLSPTSLEPEGTSYLDAIANQSVDSAEGQRALFAAAINGGQAPVTLPTKLNGAGASEPMARGESNQSGRTSRPLVPDFEEEPVEPGVVAVTTTSRRSSASSTESNANTRRKRSSSAESFHLPRRLTHLPVEELPGRKILDGLDSLLGTAEEPSAPSALDNPPRQLLLHAPVLQVVNAHTVKDRYLFLFTDLLLIAKPLIEDSDGMGVPQPATLDSAFVVKSVVELKHLNLATADEAGPHGSSPSASGKQQKHPLLVAFVDRFANDPKRAIASLIQKGGLSNDGPTIARLLFANPDLNRNQVGSYLAEKPNRHILRAFIERFRFGGVRIDDALRMFMMTMRLPHNLEAVEYVLGVLAAQWTEMNGNSGFDPTLTLSLVLAIMRLSDALHSGIHGEDGLFSFPNGAITVDDFVASFRERDTRLLVQEELLSKIFASVRKERIEQASDNSIFSMTPDIQAAMEPAKLPDALTYRTPSEPITISIPAPDPKFSIKLHGTDLKFDPPVLSFAKSSTQTFRVTGGALGVRAMVLIKSGANAPRYQGLPINKAFSIERAFMQHTFQINFVNHLDLKRKYMFSTLDGAVRHTWLRRLRDRRKASLELAPATDRARAAADEVAVQVLRDVLIGNEEAPVALSSAAPSPRVNTAAPRFGTPLLSPGGPAKGRLGTSRGAGAGAGAGMLVRSNSASRLYPVGAGKAENDLGPSGKPLPAGHANAPPSRRSSRDEPASASGHPNARAGTEIATTVEQNSLLPLVLRFLEAGLPGAPEPMSMSGSAFQLAQPV